MNIIHSRQLLLVTPAGWINRQQQDTIAYMQEENRTLLDKLEGRRIRFADDERLRGAFCAQHQGELPESHNLLWREFAAASAPIHQASSKPTLPSILGARRNAFEYLHITRRARRVASATH
ncbi:MAG: hypothetical protein V3R87_10970, partial [Dehalococcoidia bacterium]